MMDIRQLDQMFQQGAHQDWDLAEYQFMRRFCELTQPRTITVVGGHTNLDLFYATQECEPDVTNWDPGWSVTGRNYFNALHKRYQQATGFRGRYQWVQQSVERLAQVDTAVDLLWISHGTAVAAEIQQWPRSLVIVHYGRLTMVQDLLRAHKDLPMVALGRRIAVFTAQEHEWDHHTYSLRRDQALGPIRPVTEIVR